MKPRRARTWLASLCLLGAAPCAPSCIDTDPAVFVDATLDNPTVGVANEALGTRLIGSFRLTLHLGARASGSSSVTFGTFTLKDGSGTVLVDSLPVTASAEAPVTVEAGGADTVIDFELDTGTDLLPIETRDAVCAGDVIISGVIEDSLATSQTPVETDLFGATGCP